ncbi:MAG: hypothetical protein ABWK53_12455 [Anaerolineales bacterium]
MEAHPSNSPSSAGKPTPWLVAGVVVVVLCCTCFGALGLILAFGKDLLNAFGL